MTTHRAHAEKLLEQGLDALTPRAQAEASLAVADAVDRLTAVLAGATFPALEVSGSVMRGNCVIRPVKR